MKVPSWWPHSEAPANERDLELERVTGRLGILAKRVEQLELQFGNMYDDVCNWIGRIRDLERQLLWMDVPAEKPKDIEEYHKAKLKAWLEGDDTNAAKNEDKAEAIRRTIRFVRGENNADKRKKRKK